ncbi:hypothetical protein [Priestia megaterium]|uniref:hypothetical protein n=2 Tax=Priestia megaterium TaxID=1404 RepID=UPI0030006980
MEQAIQHLDLSAHGLWFPITVSLCLFILAFFLFKRKLTWRDFYITFSVVGFVGWLCWMALLDGFVMLSSHVFLT